MAPQPYVTLESSSLAAVIDPHGAQLLSFKTRLGKELLWQGDPAYWPEHAPILFPVIGPLENGLLRHRGKAYPMPPHGFARQRDFAVAQRTATNCVFELRDDAETRAHYPFAFRLNVEFALTAEALRATISVANLGDEALPADVGFHPGFVWPLTEGRPKEEYVLRFAEAEPEPIRRGTGDPVSLYPEGRPTPVEGGVLRLRDDLFEDLAIVFDRLRSRSCTFGVPGGLGLQLDFPDSPYLGVWSVPGAHFVAIEPWQGLPRPVDFDGAFVEKPGIALIDPGASHAWRLIVTPQPFGDLPRTAR